jgi:hypothetical protein
MFSAALHDRHPALVELAWQDVANAVAGGALAGSLSPDTIRSILELLCGGNGIAQAWSDIEEYLDQIAPASVEVPDFTASTDTSTSATTALAHWIARYLGHPVHIVDFGARRTLQLTSRAAAHQALTGPIEQGGWPAEAALLSLLTARPGDTDTALPPELAAALSTAAHLPDGICRYLARRAAARHHLEITRAAPRPLPAAYQLSMPPVPPPKPPVCNKHGVPYIDMHNPSEVLAPWDHLLRRLAVTAGIDEATVLHRAASLASSQSDAWLRGGQPAQAQRLQRRQQLHPYRLWSYMAGRRAIAQVLAELSDAGRLGQAPEDLPSVLGLIDTRLARIYPQPVPAWIPRPWRPPGTAEHDTAGWCAETGEAIQEYRGAYTAARPFVLAEAAEWHCLEWDVPTEYRTLVTLPRNRALPSDITELTDIAWDLRTDAATDYPHFGNPASGDTRLVVRGLPQYSDAAHMEWLALHPRIGTRLGWVHDANELFTWNGPDGRWRARSTLFQRGQLGHRPLASTVCTQTWQLQLSEPGRAELYAEFPYLATYLYVSRAPTSDTPASAVSGSLVRVSVE